MSPRTLTAGVQTATLAGVVHGPIYLAKFEFDSATLRFNNSDRNYTVDVDGDGALSYLGVGRIGGISGISEHTELKANRIQLSMSGIPGDQISIALSEPFQGRSLKIWAAYLDEDFQIIADPIVAWQGFLDLMDIVLGDTASVSVTAENELVRWERPNISRYTNEDQQLQYPGDRGLEYMTNSEQEFLWGFRG